MFRINFYADANGRQPVKEYLDDLRSSSETNKDDRIRLKKITEYMDVLAANGTRAGKPYVEHIDGDIWELRPLSTRIFFFCWLGDKFIMLHHFEKKTRKTPEREKEKAKREMKDFIQRSEKREK
jgi:phage-related protein